MRQMLGLCALQIVLAFYSMRNTLDLEDFKKDFKKDFLEDFNGGSALINHDEINRQSGSRGSDYYKVGSRWIRNPWYGWSPKIRESMDCAWEDCWQKNKLCSQTCRNSPKDLRLDRRRFPPFDDINYREWIPDATMLRRMYIDGQDANGDPWPPRLDDDLCQLMDGNLTKEVLDAVPIIDPPIRRPRIEDNNNNNNKVLCMIYTTKKKHATAIRAMRETWASGCDGFLAFSTKSDPRIPAISIPHDGPEEYHNMWQKVRSMWQFVAQHYRGQFDWFYIGGDDLFVFPQNLKQLLASYNSSEPHYLGKRIQARKQIGFNNGGPGYALSRPAMECLVEHLHRKRCYPRHKSFQEDVLVSVCLARACKIFYEDTRDEQQRERFHHFDPATEYDADLMGREEWYKNLTASVGGIRLGKDCCAPDTVSFHYIKNPVLVRYLHHYVHNCKNRRIKKLAR